MELKKSKLQMTKMEGTFWQKRETLCGFAIDNKTLKLYYNTKINGEYNK